MGFFDWEQLFLGTCNIDDHGKLSFAYFALKFLKIVVLGTADYLFFDFEMNPLGQAFEMDSATRAHAHTRVEQEVVSIFSLFETDFALGFFVSIWRFIILVWFL